MVEEMLDVLKHAVMITGFVFMMMLVIEYVNVLTRGAWQQQLVRHKWGQHVVASFLGATPGCLGAFAVVAMYSHGTITLGAVVAAMVATSGDAVFVMFALVPRTALVITGVLFVLGVASGVLTDLVFGRRMTTLGPGQQPFELHEEECEFFPRGAFLRQWRECSAARGILTVVLTLFLIAVVSGQVGDSGWDWIRVTVLGVTVVALFIVTTVPDHFLDEHLWKHVARKDVPRVFLWTLGALLVLHLLTERLHLEGTIQKGRWVVLLAGCLVGLIPDSGPHIAFVTLYAQGVVPLSVLLANSIVQDGHGMLPMLAHSRRAFVGVKAVNFVVGLVVGALVMLFGR